MFKNYFIVALRNFWRNKVFSVINVLGLSIGISAALVIFLIVYFELGYDRFEKDGDRIYRVVMDMKFDGNPGHSAALPAPLGTAVQNELTGIEKTMPTFTFQGDGTAKVSIVREDPSRPVIFKKQPNIVFTNQQYLQLLGYKWLTGSAQNALQNPFSVVLSETKAKQYFPNTPLTEVPGKQITYNDDLTITVTGVVKDLNERSSFTADEFISLPTIAKTSLQNNFMMNVWDDWMAYSQLYVQLAKGSTTANVEAQMNGLLKKYNKNANKDNNNTMAFRLQPLNDIHFNTDYTGFNQRVANRPTMYGLLAIAAFLLLLGCINFINLTTAQASQRAKEIGIRKTMGSSRKQLVFQFLSETAMITVVATALSIILTPLLLKMFADFIPPGLQFNLMNQPGVILFLVLLIITVSFLSGLYPAMVLSGYKPVLVLKNQAFVSSGQTRSAWIRKTLTVSQFVIAQFFIIGTLMVSKQIHYSLNSDMGFNKEAIVNFFTPRGPRDSTTVHKLSLLQSKIEAIPEVKMVSRGFLTPADDGAAFGNITYFDGKKEIKAQVQVRWGDTNYLKIYQIKLLAGRNVMQGDSIKECLINNTYAKILGFKQPADALNKMINWNNRKLAVAGVMADFHEQSMHTLIDPVVFESRPGDIFHIKLQPQNADGTVWQSAIAKLTQVYSEVYPGEDFDYSFFDEKIAKFYASEQKTSSLLKWATGLAVFISCLGLFGLVIYTTTVRTKEIGIRKILGASVTNIVSILSKDFVQLVLIAFVIAAPVAWWASYKWLEGFVYKTGMSWWIFVVGGIAMIVLALITLSMQIIKAALANPAKSLRVE